jgi:integrase
MNEKEQTYGPFHDPDLPSLADVLGRFVALPDETPSRKARARAAVAMYSRLAHKPPADIPAQPIVIMHQFTRFKRLAAGLSAKSLANCKSELRYLLEKSGAHTGRFRFRPLTPAWEALRERIKEEYQLHAKVSRWMSFCSGQGIAPGEVNDSIVEEFRCALLDCGEVDRPEQKVRDMIRAWNELAASSDFPLPALTVAPHKGPPRWTIEPERFPKSFQDEVSRWLNGRAHVDLEAEEGPVRPLRPASLSLYRHDTFKAATALVFCGRVPIESVTSLSCLVDLDNFKAILKFLRQRQGGQPSAGLRTLAGTLVAIARHNGVDQELIARMSRIIENYKVEGHITRTHARLQAFDDERLLGAILHLPDRLWAESADEKTKKPTARVLAQIGVALEIGFHAPYRLGNMTALRLGHNIQPVMVGGKKRWMVRFSGNETKNHTAIVHEIPAKAVNRIERALRLYEQPDGWIFPGTNGSHKNESLFSKQLKDVVEERLGVPFHMHMLRGLIATVQIKEGNSIELARASLGDSSDRVIRRHYTSTAEIHLIRKGQETIRKVRIRTAPMVAGRGKPIKAA